MNREVLAAAKAATEAASREKKPVTRGGRVTAVDGSSVTVLMDDGGTITANSETKLPVDDDRVTVRFDADGGLAIVGLKEGFS